MIELNDNTWNEFISKNEKVLVDVYGDACGPCVRMEPILMEVESIYRDHVAFAKINGMANVERLSHYGIRAVPTLFYFKSGKLMHKDTGFRNAQEIESRIQEYLL
jgi:thioredoxin 1